MFANWIDSQINMCGRVLERLPEVGGQVISFRRWTQTLFAHGKGKRLRWTYAQACARDDPFVVWSLNNLVNSVGPPRDFFAFCKCYREIQIEYKKAFPDEEIPRPPPQTYAGAPVPRLKSLSHAASSNRMS